MGMMLAATGLGGALAWLVMHVQYRRARAEAERIAAEQNAEWAERAADIARRATEVNLGPVEPFAPPPELPEYGWHIPNSTDRKDLP